MEILECFVQGKRPDQSLCEDGWVMTPHFVAVVDGSTSKVPGRAGGLVAKECVCAALHNLLPTADKSEMLRFLTEGLAALSPAEARWQAAYRPTCSAVIYSVHRRVVWFVGDCQCRWQGQTYTNLKPIDDLLTGMRCDAVTYLLAHGYTPDELQQHDLGRAFILDALRDQTNFQNDPNPLNPYRYPVLDGTPVPPELVPEIPVPDSVTECILASDGYPELCDTLAESEQVLHERLAADPLCVSLIRSPKARMAGNHSFDDRCYLRFSL